MPILAANKGRYPVEWAALSHWVRFLAGWSCQFCGAANRAPHPVTGSKVVLTVAHLDHVPENCAPDNLRALCQRCHLAYDREHHRVTRAESARAQLVRRLLA
jgi:5-methylcytosine-specific restriction endonuclease McrA